MQIAPDDTSAPAHGLSSHPQISRDEGLTADEVLPRYAVGIVHHRSYDDLERCLLSIRALGHPPDRVVVVDADPDRERARAMSALHPEVLWDPGPNRGFAGGANRVLERVQVKAPDAEFAVVLNPDVVLDPDWASALFRELVWRPEVALACGKLLRSSGGLIDSAGIALPRNRRPRDRGSEAPDRGQFDRTEYVFGASGAALVLRVIALDDLTIEGEVFDEDFFLYHEDTDLAWRCRLLGWKVLYVPHALAVHDRSWSSDRRFDVPASVRLHSFKNHYLQIIKNERGRDLLLNLPIMIGWELMRLTFALLRDRAVLGGYREAWRLSGRAWRKRKIIRERARELRSPSTVSVVGMNP